MLKNKVHGEADRDSRGFRFIIPQLYLCAGESFECLLAYQRYLHDLPDDFRDPTLHMVVSLAFLRTGNKTKAQPGSVVTKQEMGQKRSYSWN